jgi:hypothetical protein
MSAVNSTLVDRWHSICDSFTALNSRDEGRREGTIRQIKRTNFFFFVTNCCFDFGACHPLSTSVSFNAVSGHYSADFFYQSMNGTFDFLCVYYNTSVISFVSLKSICHEKRVHL